MVLCFFIKGNKLLSDKNTAWQAHLERHLESKVIFALHTEKLLRHNMEITTQVAPVTLQETTAI